MDQPITNPVPKSTPKDVFLHLLSIVTLYSSVISFITLLWQYVNSLYPDPLNYSYSTTLNSMRWGASVLVVMYPVYVFISYLVNKDYKQNPQRREIKIRKWLVYLTLFLSAVTVIIDVITLVYNLFGGEVTIKFFLKVLAVLVTAAFVFGYYYFDLKKDSVRKRLKTLAWIISIVVAASIIGGFFLIGSPAHQRQLNFDTQRANDLQLIQSDIINYYQHKGTIPDKLSDLVDKITVSSIPTDPQTKIAYTYNKISNLEFELCANFNLPSTDDAYPRTVPKPLTAGSGQDLSNFSWSHGAGTVCFDRIIDPQLYPLLTK